MRNNSQITATATGTATGGNIAINNTENIVLFPNSAIIADAIEGNGGNISLNTQGLFIFPNGNISASSQFGIDGTIALETINEDNLNSLEELPATLIDVSNQIIAGYPSKEEANFVVTGKGGLPENSSENLTESVYLSAWETLIDTKKRQADILEKEQNIESSSMVEAQTWRVNDLGNVELVATDSSFNRYYNRMDCP